MTRPFKGRINIDFRSRAGSTSTSRIRFRIGSRTGNRWPEGSPSVLYVVLDDDGFSAREPFGGTIARLIRSPNPASTARRLTIEATFAL
jgi:hypothetical protein